MRFFDGFDNKELLLGTSGFYAIFSTHLHEYAGESRFNT
jgi:hypothetical protein